MVDDFFQQHRRCSLIFSNQILWYCVIVEERIVEENFSHEDYSRKR
jgi:hypothetical protein